MALHVNTYRKHQDHSKYPLGFGQMAFKVLIIIVLKANHGHYHFLFLSRSGGVSHVPYAPATSQTPGRGVCVTSPSPGVPVQSPVMVSRLRLR